MKSNQVFICLLALLIGFVSNSQDRPEEKQGFYVSQDGKLFWKGGKPVYLFISENSDGSDAQRLKSEGSAAYTNPMYFDTEGANFIRSKWAVDKDGNYVTPRQEIMFEVYNDGLPPKTSVYFNGAPKYSANDRIYYGQGLVIETKAKDGISGIRNTMFSANGDSFKELSTSIALDADGEFNYGFYSVDNVGNTETTSNFEFTVDVTSPVSSLTVEGDQTGDILSPRSKISLSAKDNSSGLKSIFYKVDDGPVRAYTQAISIQGLSEGDHTVTYFSSDNVNNKEAEQTYAFFLDRTAPEIVASFVGDQFEVNGKTYASSRTKVSLTSTDNKAGVKDIRYKFNNGEEQVYANAFELPEQDGAHSIMYYSTDNVNNNYVSTADDNASKLQRVILDKTPPEISYYFSGEKYESRDTTFISSRTLINLTASDSQVGVKATKYKVNGGPEITYEEAFSLDNEGYYEIEYFGIDHVGNTSSSVFSFVIDNTGPIIETILSMEPVGSISLDEVETALSVYASGVKLYLGATDEIVDTRSIYYSMNDENEMLYTIPVDISEKGINSFKIRAIDKLGNSTEIVASSIFIK